MVGYEQMDPWSFSVRPTQFTPSKGHMNKNTDLPFLPAPVGLQFHTIPMDSNAHKVQFGQMNFALFHCKGRINFGLSEQQVQVGPGWPSSPPCLGLEQSLRLDI